MIMNRHRKGWQKDNKGWKYQVTKASSKIKDENKTVGWIPIYTVFSMKLEIDDGKEGLMKRVNQGINTQCDGTNLENP